jgi:ubiquinone/menaquinone biosynthesis C-methylase UbiE
MMKETNLDRLTIDGFGDEWKRFDQSSLSVNELSVLFNRYFSIFPWDTLPTDPVGFDLGCGSGRWAKLVAPRVKKLYCVEPSDAIRVAEKNLSENTNCVFIKSSVENMPIDDNAMDFGYSLGVLHHIPDTQSALNDCVNKLKTGAPFLVYLYYAFDNRPPWFKYIWKLSELFRIVISKLPYQLRYLLSQIICLVVYFPLAKLSYLLEKLGLSVNKIPLSAYRKCSFYTMRTDALDRFGTRLEQRFTKTEIRQMMLDAGLEKIEFSEEVPFWCAVGTKASAEQET